jgi:hypothetical protein
MRACNKLVLHSYAGLFLRIGPAMPGVCRSPAEYNSMRHTVPRYRIREDMHITQILVSDQEALVNVSKQLLAKTNGLGNTRLYYPSYALRRDIKSQSIRQNTSSNSAVKFSRHDLFICSTHKPHLQARLRSILNWDASCSLRMHLVDSSRLRDPLHPAPFSNTSEVDSCAPRADGAPVERLLLVEVSMRFKRHHPTW